MKVVGVVMVGLFVGSSAKAQTSYYWKGDVAQSATVKINSPANAVDETQFWYYNAQGQAFSPGQLTFPTPANVGRLWSYPSGIHSIMLKSGGKRECVVTLYSPAYVQSRDANGQMSSASYLAAGTYILTFQNVAGWQWMRFVPVTTGAQTFVQYVQ